jgi:hypothetical protein
MGAVAAREPLAKLPTSRALSFCSRQRFDKRPFLIAQIKSHEQRLRPGPRGTICAQWFNFFALYDLTSTDFLVTASADGPAGATEAVFRRANPERPGFA